MKDFIYQLTITTIASLALGHFLATLSKPAQSIAQSPLQPFVTQPQPASEAATRLHKMSLQVNDPDDLKVAVGEAVSAGQIIADQNAERRRLNFKKEELELALKRVQEATISPPVKAVDPDKPKLSPLLLPLADISYQQYEALIQKAEFEVKRKEEIISLKRRELDYLKGIVGIDPAILEHETSKLSELESNLEIAQSELELAEGKLQTAKGERSRDEYQHQLNLARRVEEENQSQSFYQNQLAQNQIDFQKQTANYEKETRDRDYQTTQLRFQLSAIEDKIAQLAVIRSPYAGQVRRIKFVGQTDNRLNIELSLVVGGVPLVNKSDTPE